MALQWYQKGANFRHYSGYMTPPHALNIRLSQAQYRVLITLSEKLNIKKTEVIRLALSRLAVAEAILPTEHPES